METIIFVCVAITIFTGVIGLIVGSSEGGPLVGLLFGVWWGVGISFWIGVIYIVLHFVGKYW